MSTWVFAKEQDSIFSEGNLKMNRWIIKLKGWNCSHCLIKLFKQTTKHQNSSWSGAVNMNQPEVAFNKFHIPFTLETFKYWYVTVFPHPTSQHYVITIKTEQYDTLFPSNLVYIHRFIIWKVYCPIFFQTKPIPIKSLLQAVAGTT